MRVFVFLVSGICRLVTATGCRVQFFSSFWCPHSKRPIWNSRLAPFGLRFCRNGHISSFAAWPSPRPPQNPNSKIQTARIFDFGSWILDFYFGFGILDWFSFRSFCGSPKRGRLDFGFGILDCRSIRSCCGSPKRGRLDFGFRIL